MLPGGPLPRNDDLLNHARAHPQPGAFEPMWSSQDMRHRETGELSPIRKCLVPEALRSACWSSTSHASRYSNRRDSLPRAELSRASLEELGRVHPPPSPIASLIRRAAIAIHLRPVAGRSLSV